MIRGDNILCAARRLTSRSFINNASAIRYARVPGMCARKSFTGVKLYVCDACYTGRYADRERERDDLLAHPLFLYSVVYGGSVVTCECSIVVAR